MALGFGADGERYAAAFEGGRPLIAGSLDGCASALAAAVAWRRAGRTFCVAPLIDEPRALTAQRVGGVWMQTLTHIDDRYRAFDALASGRLDEAGCAVADDATACIPEPERRVLRDFAIMGDALVVRSQREGERVGRILGRHRPHVLTVPVEAALPVPSATRGEGVVVWAPGQPAEHLGVIAMALEYLRCPVTFVCAGTLRNTRGTFLDGAAGAAALGAAGIVIDASIGDPSAALALARLGIPLVAATCSGAGEFIAGSFPYDPWDWRTIFAAVTAARGGSAPRVVSEPAMLDTLETVCAHAAETLRSRGPLVNVVVLTYNRRELLSVTLDSIAAQRYGDIEIIVVNNGGVDVADIVERHPNARLITLPENMLPNAAVEIGFEACRGEYFAVTSDDDEFFPDHFSRLVDALERSGDGVAHANTVTRYVAADGGRRETIAYRVRGDRPSDRLQILVGGTMSFNSMLFRAGVRATIGKLRVELAPADLEYTVRAAQRYDFVHVDAVTCEWNCPMDGSSYTFRPNMYEGLATIYADYPSPGSTIVERRRARELERFSERRAGNVMWPPDLLLPTSQKAERS